MRLPVALQVLLLWCALGAWVYLAIGREVAQPAEAQQSRGAAHPLVSVPATSVARSIMPLRVDAAGPPAHLGPHDCYYSRLRAAADLTREEAVAMLVVAEPTDESAANQDCGVWPPPVSP